MPPKHPDQGEWADFARDLLASAKADAMRRHLRSCARCGGMVEAFARLADVGRRRSALTPTPAVLAQVYAAFSGRNEKRPWATVVGGLSYDSWAQPVEEGVRSRADSHERYLSYRIGAWRLAVRLARRSPRGVTVVGQLTHGRAKGRALTGVPVALVEGRREVAEAPLNGLGEFRFEPRSARSRLRLRISILADKTRLDIPLPDQRRTVRAGRAGTARRPKRGGTA